MVAVFSRTGVLVLCTAVLLGFLLGSAPPEFFPESLRLPPTTVAYWPAFLVKSAVHDLSSQLLHSAEGPWGRVMRLAVAYVDSEVLYALTLHGVFDAVHAAGGELSCADAAASVGGLHSEQLCRYMRAGAALGLFYTRRGTGEEEFLASNAFGLTDAGDMLRRDAAGTLRDFVLTANETLHRADRNASLRSVVAGRVGLVEAHRFFAWPVPLRHTPSITSHGRVLQRLGHRPYG
mmetsp:Transcript_113646/g.361012  ORF Transcript_113646/g.361012 Transcript_113646/m.361012 type:complete len:234 (+) Transcript_113646:81-782(+)